MLKTLARERDTGGSNLEEFTAHARSKGMEYATIWRLLSAGGWKEKEIARVIAADGLERSIPSASQKGGAREAFFHLSAFTCLYVAAISLIVMLFNLIDIALPDPTDSYWEPEWTYSSIRSALSTVIVFAPLYVVFNWLIRRERHRGVTISGGGVERWLTYLTLFAIVMAILVDASVLIYLLFEGEMTARVLLKGFTLLAVAGGAFAYLWTGTHRWSVRSGRGKKAALPE